MDAVGVALDVAATTTGLAGGAGTVLRLARAADKVATATGAARAGDAATALAKRVPNPGGKLGDDVTKTRTAEIRADLKDKGFNTDTEVIFKTPGGEKSKRFADVVGTHEETGKRVVVQIGKKNKRGDPVARERRAMKDIRESPEFRKDDELIFIEK